MQATLANYNGFDLDRIYQTRYVFDNQGWLHFKMAASLDILQLTRIYLPQTGSFCLYKDLPGILGRCQ